MSVNCFISVFENVFKIGFDIVSVLSTMKELVKHVSSLVNVCGDKPTYSPVAKASSGGKASSGTLIDVIAGSQSVIP